MAQTKADWPCSSWEDRSPKPLATAESSECSTGVGLQQRGDVAVGCCHQLRKPGSTGWLHCLQMAGAAAEVAMDLAAIKQDIQTARRDMQNCEDPKERRELRQYMTALMEKEARLAGGMEVLLEPTAETTRAGRGP